jgi:5'-nucleotidase
MSYLLVTNDDGVDSPSVVPLMQALSDLGPVRAVFPDGERSWIGKAITRFDELEVGVIEREGLVIHTASGFPADCVQLGMHSLFDAPPDFVVSGINMGYNYGSAFAAGSGTIGAAAEAALAGIPAMAFSAGTVAGEQTFQEWRERVMAPAARPEWERVAAVVADIVADVRRIGFPSGVDVMSVNMPFDAGLGTTRRICRLASTRYDGLFRRNGDGSFVHAYRGELHRLASVAGTDLEAADQGVISITPIRLPHSIPESELSAVAFELERP